MSQENTPQWVPDGAPDAAASNGLEDTVVRIPRIPAADSQPAGTVKPPVQPSSSSASLKSFISTLSEKAEAAKARLKQNTEAQQAAEAPMPPLSAAVPPAAPKPVIPAPAAKVEAAVQPEAKGQPDAKVEAEPKGQPKPEAKSAPEPEAKAESKGAVSAPVEAQSVKAAPPAPQAPKAEAPKPAKSPEAEPTQQIPQFQAPAITQPIPAVTAPIPTIPPVTQPVPAVTPAVGQASATQASAPVTVASIKNRKKHRKALLRIAKVDPWSVMKTSFMFSIVFGIIFFVAVWASWTVIEASGIFDALNETVSGIISNTQSSDQWRIENFINRDQVLGYSALIAAVNVLLLTALGTLGAFLYNLAATVIGGIEVTLADD
ncbi:MAG: DUF3566 domain-containing protein [Propionibacteriaceae bacterium]|nr:DUF3566 domain-containing protein [Propionibacteriaceae bacterium]